MNIHTFPWCPHLFFPRGRGSGCQLWQMTLCRVAMSWPVYLLWRLCDSAMVCVVACNGTRASGGDRSRLAGVRARLRAGVVERPRGTLMWGQHWPLAQSVAGTWRPNKLPTTALSGIYTKCDTGQDTYFWRRAGNAQVRWWYCHFFIPDIRNLVITVIRQVGGFSQWDGSKLSYEDHPCKFGTLFLQFVCV